MQRALTLAHQLQKPEGKIPLQRLLLQEADDQSLATLAASLAVTPARAAVALSSGGPGAGSWLNAPTTPTMSAPRRTQC